MAKKKTQIPKYGTITLKGIQYYRTRITDADGKELSLYAATCEELYEKQLEARKKVEEIICHRQMSFSIRYLRREEVLALQWDCVFLDEDTPYLSVRRAWRTEHNRPVVSTEKDSGGKKGYSDTEVFGGLSERNERKFHIRLCDR